MLMPTDKLIVEFEQGIGPIELVGSLVWQVLQRTVEGIDVDSMVRPIISNLLLLFPDQVYAPIKLTRRYTRKQRNRIVISSTKRRSSHRPEEPLLDGTYFSTSFLYFCTSR